MHEQAIEMEVEEDPPGRPLNPYPALQLCVFPPLSVVRFQWITACLITHYILCIIHIERRI
jgi:hypothetical protein